MKRKPKKKNPQDATLRNIRALKERVENLENAVKILFHELPREIKYTIMMKVNKARKQKG